MTQCAAKSKRTGQQCRAKAMANGKCYHHGGKALKGIANPNTKHGRYSKDLPTRMLANYEAERSDPELLNLSEAIALVRSRQMELMRRVDKGESGRIWKELRDTYRQMKDAQKAKDGVEVARLLSDLGATITQGHADNVAWSELVGLMEQERKLIETEQKRRVAMKTMITSEQAGVMLTTIMDSVKRNVSDTAALAAIAADVARYFGRPTD